MPDPNLLEGILQSIESEVPGIEVEAICEHNQACLVVKPDHIIDLLRNLRDNPQQQYTFLASVHAADYLPNKPRFAIHYELLSMERSERIRVKAPIEDPEDGHSLPQIDSCVGLFPTANFQEREVYDMFGIEFRGHPDLRRILMPDGYGGHPQRRDFPLGGEKVEFSFNENEVEHP